MSALLAPIESSSPPSGPRLRATYNEPVGIGSILYERGLITDEQLTHAIAEQNRSGERLDRVLIRLGFVRSGDVLDAIGHQFAMPIVDLNTIEVDPETLKMLPPSWCSSSFVCRSARTTARCGWRRAIPSS